MMMTKILLACFLGATAFAQQPASPTQPSAQVTQQSATIGSLDERETRVFRRFDRNDDGMISLEEYRNQIVRFFERVDKRRHGYVDENDVRTVDPDDLKDKANDPKDRMSLEDFQKVALADFQKADANHDGQLSPDEFKTWLQEVKERRGQSK